MKSVKDIRSDRLVEICKKINSELGGIISKYQSLLDKSESKEEDFVIIDFAMEDLMNEMYDKFDYDDYEAIFMDAEAALMPMPEGVVNQTANILFNPKHLEILTDCNPISGATFSLEESSLYPNVEEGIKEAREHVGEMFSVEDSKKVRDKDTYDYEVHIMLKEPDENLDKKALNEFLFEYFGLDDDDFFGYDSESGMIGLATDKKRITKDELKEAFTKFIKKSVEDSTDESPFNEINTSYEPHIIKRYLVRYGDEFITDFNRNHPEYYRDWCLDKCTPEEARKRGYTWAPFEVNSLKKADVELEIIPSYTIIRSTKDMKISKLKDESKEVFTDNDIVNMMKKLDEKNKNTGFWFDYNYDKYYDYNGLIKIDCSANYGTGYGEDEEILGTIGPDILGMTFNNFKNELCDNENEILIGENFKSIDELIEAITKYTHREFEDELEHLWWKEEQENEIAYERHVDTLIEEMRNRGTDSNTVKEASPKKVVATCETQKTRDGFKHIVKVIVDGKVYEGVVGYINRTWEAYDYQTALIKAIKEMKLFNEDEISDLYKLDSFESVIEEVKKRV